jgi:hypothetical protein
MAYTRTNFQTKKALKDAVASGQPVDVFQSTPAGPAPVPDGISYLEGPHFPQPHSWYAQVEVKSGKIVKVKR